MRRFALKILIAGLSFLPMTSLSQPERRQEGALVFDNVPPVSVSARERLNQFQNIRSAWFADWLPDSSGLLIGTRFGETSQLHIVEEPMGMRRQVTFYEERVGDGSFNPVNPSEILFAMDEDGNERDQLFLHDLSTGKCRRLTDGKAIYRSPMWANNKELIACSTTQRNGKDWDIQVLDRDGNTTSVLEAEGYWGPDDWSLDDSKLLIGRYLSANESQLYVHDLNSGELHQLNADLDQPVAYGSACFNYDGSGVFYTADFESEFKRLYYYDLKYDLTKILVDDIDWDIVGLKPSRDRRFLAMSTNEDGFSKLYVLNAKTMQRTEVPLPGGLGFMYDFSPDSKYLAVTLMASNSPADVYVWDLQEQKLTRWTESEVGGLPSDIFVEAELIHYPTFDEVSEGTPRRIPAFVYRPKTQGPWPVVISIHGGPESQARPGFSSDIQYMVTELGVAVVVPNVRGSTGYGKTYVTLDNQEKREDSVKDIGALLDWIAMQPDFDEDRVMVTGGSYGGYMVLASMAHYSDRLAGGVSTVGISNFVTFLESTSEYRRDLRRVEYGDERVPEMREFLLSISPTTLAHKIQKPLFIVQGYNDPRVPYTEAEQIVDQVRANGQEVWYLLAMDEGHGIAKKSNRMESQAAQMSFIQRFLLNNGDGEPTAIPTPEVPESGS